MSLRHKEFIEWIRKTPYYEKDFVAIWEMAWQKCKEAAIKVVEEEYNNYGFIGHTLDEKL